MKKATELDERATNINIVTTGIAKSSFLSDRVPRRRCPAQAVKPYAREP